MVNCSSSACPVPNNLAVTNFNGSTATVSWTENGSATAWQLCLDGDEANPIDVTENPYTLSGLDPDVFHNVKVRANCGSDYSLWSDPTAFAQVHSTGNWYAYVQSCPNNSSLPNKFVSFTAQDPATATAASDVFPGTLAATYTVQAVCDPGISESVWTTAAFTLMDVQSSANWYAYAQASMDHPEWNRKFISFSMQDLNTVDTASETIYDYPVALTYANGYVWGCFYDNNTSNINPTK